MTTNYGARPGLTVEPRTMSAEQLRECERVLDAHIMQCGPSELKDVACKLWDELDAERAAHAATRLWGGAQFSEAASLLSCRDALSDLLASVDALNHELRAWREAGLGQPGAGVASSAVGIMAQHLNRHIAVDSAARTALAQARGSRGAS